MEIGILDYGAGNLKNVIRALDFLSTKHRLVTEVSDLEGLDKLIVPGVGAFSVAMQELRDQNLITAIIDCSLDNLPILGICLGMQLLFDSSDEFGFTEGLGLLEGPVRHINKIAETEISSKLRTPHVGWATLNFRCEDPLFKGLTNQPMSTYFVHSHMACPIDRNRVIASTNYDGLEIPAVVKVRNTYGCQFHPEKSGEPGLSLLRNFVGLEV